MCIKDGEPLGTDIPEGKGFLSSLLFRIAVPGDNTKLSDF